MWSQAPFTFALATTATGQTSTTPLPGSHTSITLWCGKPYMAGYADSPPGGMLEAPIPSPNPMLFIQFESRHTIYDSSEPQGQFIVETSLSYTHGEPFEAPTQPSGAKYVIVRQNIDFEIRLEGVSRPLVVNCTRLSSGPRLFEFEFGNLEPRLKPYSVILDATWFQEDGDHKYAVRTELYYLPAKNRGSTVKVDRLNGGMLVANHVTRYSFQPLLPFGFYTSCSGYLNYTRANVAAYKGLGFNAINPVCAFTDGNLDYLFDWLDETNVWYQYDMRGSYSNHSSVAEQIPLIKDRSSFLSWYTADEPDGWQYALDSTRLAYEFLREQDPYHPTGLVLNCDNYYFKQYSSGADYIMEDAYPVGIDPTFSRPWNTTCNMTYGDCGCDNCVGELTDVSNRLDSYSKYQRWLGNWKKPLWVVLQAFRGEYWSRNPTAEESWTMMLLSFNHGAKAIMSWQFPTSTKLIEAHSAFAKVATMPPVSTLLLNSEPTVFKVESHEKLDVAYWSYGNQIMVGIVNTNHKDSETQIEVELPFAANDIQSQPWGNVSWILLNSAPGTALLRTEALKDHATSIIILERSIG